MPPAFSTTPFSFRRCLWALASALASLVPCSMAARPSGEPLTLQLKWRHQFQFAGYYAALEKGYYREAGLEVRLVEAGPDMDPVREVVEGRADYGVGTSALLLARDKGAPVVVLAVVFQHSPLVLLAREASDLRSVHDLKGRKVMLEHQSEELLAFLLREGIPAGAIRTVPYAQGIPDLVGGTVDAISAYSTTEPFLLEQEGFRHLQFSPRAVGIDFYGDNLFTTESEVQRNPARVEAFRAASLRGWRYALQHREEIVKLIHTRYAPQRSLDFLRSEALETTQLMRQDLIEPGYMNAGRWRHIADTYADLGLLPRGLALTPFLYDPTAAERALQRRLKAALTLALPVGGVLTLLAGTFFYLNRRLNREVQARTLLADRLAEKESRFRFLAEHSTDVIWTMDPRTRQLTYVSPSVRQLLGLDPEELLTRPALETLTPESAARMEAHLAQDLAAWDAGHSSAPRRVEVDQVHRSGRIIPVEAIISLHGPADSPATSLLGVSRDITERRRAEAQLRQSLRSLEQMASTDLLTGAWNRHHFEAVVEGEMHRARRYGHPLSLLMLDLDHFKRINDCHGHHEGDRALQVVADRIRGAIRLSDSLTRWGGEEFIILMPNTGLASAGILAERIREAVGTVPIPRLGPVTASIGLAEYLPTASRDAWLERADRALYRAKHAGRNRVEADPLEADQPPEEGPVEGTFLKLVWKPSYRCGHCLIDTQHEALFHRANDLLDAALVGRPEEEILQLVQRLMEEVARHFSDEERLLAELAFPGREAHAEKHALLLAQAQELQRAFQGGNLSIGSLFQFLAHEVVAMHMLKADREFFPLLDPCGGSAG